MSDDTATPTLTEDFGAGGAAPLHGFTLTVIDSDVSAPAGAPKSFAISAERCSIGSASNNDVVIEDPSAGATLGAITRITVIIVDDD